MRTLFFIGIIAITFSCKQNKNISSALDSGVHKVIALEKINTSQYTYILANDNGIEKWLAIPLADIKIGETYFYTNELPMTNFASKELGKTFETVYFIEKFSTEPPSIQKNGTAQNRNPQPLQISNPHTQNAIPKPEKVAVKIEQSKGIISIADLLSKKEKFAGKKVTVKGKVTKFSPKIMGKNWIHLQDGTDFNGVFDLTITSQNDAKVGDVITLEGTISLDKDFGAGYHYDIILEDAVVK